MSTIKEVLLYNQLHNYTTFYVRNYKKYIDSIKNNIQRLKTSLPDKISFTDTLKKDIFEDAFPPPQKSNEKTNDVLYALIDSKSGLGYMDLTGRFPYQSSRGNNYLMVAYNYDANAILVEALKNRQAASIVDAWKIIHKKFNDAGVQPNTYILDNECSGDLKNAFHKDAIGFQRVPPSCHRANMAERAILTLKVTSRLVWRHSTQIIPYANGIVSCHKLRRRLISSVAHA